MAENTNKENKKTEDDPFDTCAVAIKSFNKAIEKNVQDMTSAGLQSGVNPQELLSSLLSTFNVKQQNSTPSTEDILNTVLSLSETPIPTGEKMNRVASLFRGHGFQRTDITQPLGVDNAIDVIQLQNTMQQSEQGIPKQNLDMLKTILDIVPELQKLTKGQEGETIETDISGKPTTKGIEQQQTAQVRTTRTEEDRISK